MKIEEKVVVIPARESKTTKYVCEICANEYSSADDAIKCEKECKPKKEFSDKHTPRYEIGSLVKTIAGGIFVLRDCHVFFEQYMNPKVGFAYNTEDSLDMYGDNCQDRIFEDWIEEVVLSAKELKDLISSLTPQEGYIFENYGFIINQANKSIEITTSIYLKSFDKLS